MDWKPKDPDAIKVYFNCRTRLIETFREVFRDEFRYEGNRAIVVPLDANIDDEPLGNSLKLALKMAFKMALRYHNLEHRPLLGA